MSVERLKKLLAEWIAPALPANPLVVNLVEHVGYLEQQHKRDYHLKEAEKVAQAQQQAEFWSMQKEQHQATMAHYKASLKELAAMTTRREEDIVRWKLERVESLEVANNTTLALKAIEKVLQKFACSTIHELGKPCGGPQNVPGYGYTTIEKAPTPETVQLIFNICGEKIPVAMNTANLLSVALTWAIEHSHYTGHPITKFDMRDARGTTLSPDSLVEKLNFTDGDLVFVGLKAHMGEG